MVQQRGSNARLSTACGDMWRFAAEPRAKNNRDDLATPARDNAASNSLMSQRYFARDEHATQQPQLQSRSLRSPDDADTSRFQQHAARSDLASAHRLDSHSTSVRRAALHR
ncbi:MAG: hypothetical protein AB1586_32910 [Pseudomonadota bacterium]